MRKLIMWNLVTLDGYFEGAKNWDLPWHEQLWGEELEQFSLEQLETADMLVFGRVTYEGMAAHWTTAQGAVADYMNTGEGQRGRGGRTAEAAGQWKHVRLRKRQPLTEPDQGRTLR